MRDPLQGFQISGVNLRMFNLAGVPKDRASCWFALPGTVSLNMLVGTRLSVNAHEYLAAAKAPGKEPPVVTFAHLMSTGGLGPAPYVDVRTDKG